LRVALASESAEAARQKDELVMPKLAIISAAGLALVINTSSSASAAQIVSEKDRLYCERQAAADWRRLKICLSYFENAARDKARPSPKTNNSHQPKASSPPTVKGRSASGYEFIGTLCYNSYA